MEGEAAISALHANAPPGASIDPQTGEFSWRPPPDQAAGKYDVTVSVQGPGRPDGRKRHWSITVIRPIAARPTCRARKSPWTWASGVKLEMVLIPAGEFLMGSPDSDKDASRRREAAAPGADHQAVLPGQVSGDAGAVGSRDGQQPERLQGAEEPGGAGQLGRLPGVSGQAECEDRGKAGKFHVADRGAVGICLPGGEHDALLLRGR